MYETALSYLAKSAILLAALCGLAVCVLWYPFSISLTTFGVGIEGGLPATTALNVQFWTQLLFYWLTALPCFCVLVFGWKIATAIEKNTVFTSKTAREFRISAWILFIDIAVYLLGNLITFALGWNDYALIYFFLVLAGTAIAVILAVAAHFVGRAATLQEEAEGTL